MDVDVNILAVLAAGVGSMVIGGIWYMLFAKALKNIRKLTAAEEKQAQQQMGAMFGVGLILSFLMAYVLFHTMALSENFYHMGPVKTGFVSAFWVYIGFAMPVQATHIIFGNYGHMAKKLKLFAINTGGQFISLVTMGMIIGLMQ